MTALSFKTLVRGGLLAFPLAFAGLPLYLQIPDLYATHYQVSLSSLGVLLLVLRAIDAFQDPFIGMLSDRAARYRQLIFTVSCIIFIAALIAVFHPLPFGTIIWLGVFLYLATTAHSVLTINLNSLGSLWSQQPDDKNRIIAVREGLGVLGLIFAAVTLPLLQRVLPFNTALSTYVVVLGVICGLCCFYFLRWLRQSPFTTATVSVRQRHALLPEYMGPRIIKLYVVYAISMLASSLPAVLVMFYIRDFLQAEKYTGGFLLIYFVSGMVSLPLWRRVAQRYGSYVSWLIGMGVAALCFTYAATLTPGAIIGYTVVCATSGVAFGADLLFPPALLSHKIDRINGQHDTASYFALLAFLLKLSLSVASFCALGLLDRVSFQPNADNTSHATQWLVWLYTLIPVGLKLLGIGLAVLWRPTTNEKHFLS